MKRLIRLALAAPGLLGMPLLAPSTARAECPQARPAHDASAFVRALQKLIYKLDEKTSPDGCPSPWHCEPLDFLSSHIRSGYLPEDPGVPFKGNVMYYEGLGDSMLNHLPLFRKLSAAGYRVIAFDYMGQGGSTGNMDNTRISDIPKIGDLAWSRYARDLKDFPRKNLIGWSTGGLAAFYAAHANDADRVVLIAPGVAANYLVGESRVWPPEVDEITLPTLTTATYGGRERNPHLDPIRPASPLAVPDFALDLQRQAFQARHSWRIPGWVGGLTLLSGPRDTYVDADKTVRALRKSAPGFKVERFEGALHEIDNEAPAIASRAQDDILSFLESP